MTSASLPRRVQVGFAITQHCNLRCPHCIRDDITTVRSLPSGLFRSVVDQARGLFPDVGVSLTGGEPLLHPELDELVDYLEGLAVPWRLVTNGWHTRRALPILEAYPPEFVRLSLSGVDRPSHDEIRGRGSFQRVLLSAALLTAREIRFGLSLIVDRRTVGSLAAAATLARELGALELQYILPQPVSGSLDQGTELPLERWAAVRDEVQRLATHGGRTGLHLAYGAPFAGQERLCPAKSFEHLYVDARGRLCTCCLLSDYGANDADVVADLSEVSLAEAWDRHVREVIELTARSGRRDDPADPLDPFPCLRCARSCGKLPDESALQVGGLVRGALPILPTELARA